MVSGRARSGPGKLRKKLGFMFERSNAERQAPPVQPETVKPETVQPPKRRDGDDEPVCRVCYGHHGPRLPNHLVSPCNCRGDLEFVHRKCLYNWMEAKPGTGPTKNACEICKAAIDSKTLLGPLRGEEFDEDAPAQIAFCPFFGKKSFALTM